MKYLKHFESNAQDEEIEFHIQQIEDIFLDVKDEFGIEAHVSFRNEKGLFYSIAKSPYYAYDTNIPQIRLWIANISDNRLLISKKILHSQTLRDFERRLINMGYTFKSGDTKTRGIKYNKLQKYYEIIISYENI